MDKTIAKYKSHTHREHIYKIPDTYIGSVELSTIQSWKLEDTYMTQAQLSYIPGLTKLLMKLSSTHGINLFVVEIQKRKIK